MQAGQNIPFNGHGRSDDSLLETNDVGGEAAEGKQKSGFKLRPVTAAVRRNILLVAGITAAVGAQPIF
ncbi:MAG: hypothetical protein HC866_03105 [Leptolyngbyaceae cyanobacterium RU_5_1]|nr:hypothetical protein [Leptolyngbyaceae cyanobacterium RU_5_1]